MSTPYRLPNEFETARYHLRSVKVDDATLIFDSYATDAEVTRYLGWKPHRSIADTSAFLEIAAAEWDLGNDGSNLSGNQQPRRFNNIMPMPLQIGVDNDRIADLVGAYATHCGLKVRLKSDTISRLIRGSRNRFGTCIDLIINAIEIALHQSADSLAVEYFEIAWGQLEGCELSQNVFAVNDWTTLEFPEEQADQNNGAPGQRPRAGRKRKG